MSSEIKQAKLPREHMNLTVGLMEPGESFYAPAAALVFDRDARAYLRANARVSEHYRGLMLDIGVIRTETGYVVAMLPGSKADFVDDFDLSFDDAGFVPVLEVHVTKPEALKPQQVSA